MAMTSMVPSSNVVYLSSEDEEEEDDFSKLPGIQRPESLGIQPSSGGNRLVGLKSSISSGSWNGIDKNSSRGIPQPVIYKKETQEGDSEGISSGMSLPAARTSIEEQENKFDREIAVPKSVIKHLNSLKNGANRKSPSVESLDMKKEPKKEAVIPDDAMVIDVDSVDEDQDENEDKDDKSVKMPAKLESVEPISEASQNGSAYQSKSGSPGYGLLFPKAEFESKVGSTSEHDSQDIKPSHTIGSDVNTSTVNDALKESDDDDDDIVILAPEDAAKHSFKKSSFEGRPNNRYAHEAHLRELQERRQRQERELQMRFNQPVDAPHWGPDHVPTDVVQQNLVHLQSRLDICRAEKRNVQSEFERYNVEKSRATERKSNLATELENYNDERTELLAHSSSSNNNQDRIIVLDSQIRQKAREMFELDSFISRCHTMLQSLGNRYHLIISNIRTFETKFVQLQMNQNNPMAQPSSMIDIDERNGEVLRQNLMGFANNVYSSQSDSNDLQSLLNNIQPEEEEVTEEGLEKTPAEMTITLLKHQRMGLSWMMRMENSKAKGGILADDMGLGKTVQAIALMLAHKPEDENSKTTLVVAPVSLLRQWAAEISSKIKPEFSMKIAIYHGIAKKNLSRAKDLFAYDVVLTSYGTLSSEWKKHYKEPLENARISKQQNVIPEYRSGGLSYVSPFYDHSSNASFNRIILDEAQAIKNKLAIASKAVHLIKSTYRFCMSGTPIQNNVEELFPLLRFLRIRPYNDELKFRHTFILPLRAKDDYDDVERNPALQKLRALLRAILLRRNKKTLIDGKPILNLPEKHVEEVKTEMQNEEREYYKDLEDQTKRAAAKMLEEEHLSYSNILVLLLRLRQACCHSFLVEIGKLNKIENKELEEGKLSGKLDWKKMYDSVMQFSPGVVERIQEDVGDSDTKESSAFSCPICFDVLGYESVILFPGCGHMICKNCIENFFERYEDGDNPEGRRTAKCLTCSSSPTIVKEDNLIDYNMFHKVHSDKLSKGEVLEYFEAPSAKKTSSSQKILKLVAAKGGRFTPSAKMKECMKLIKKINSENPGEKIIIFSQFLVLFDLMKLTLQNENISFLRYDGSMSIEDKNATIKRFYQEEDTKVLLLSLRAGNVGLTLTCASHVIIMDPFWNPFVEEQAQDRAHRIGQQREVFVHRLLIPDTVENRIMELQTQKKELIASAMNDEGMKNVSRLGRQELGFLFGLNSL
ncbi:hypothetical protein CLIB1423_01S11056 [[Candida] railenensis]|uniref:Uncharacterized protein n=1 Tax=[Candida] railenensis TaxID=45579 RepID=A0A9P0QKU1_9ASCO|nr:hypothetical protein CLIB1423_01S11056 [[Candida] railenensis]